MLAMVRVVMVLKSDLCHQEEDGIAYKTYICEACRALYDRVVVQQTVGSVPLLQKPEADGTYMSPIRNVPL